MERESARCPIGRWMACAMLCLCLCDPAAFCQRAGTNPLSGTTPGAVPNINIGGTMGGQFAQLDFAQKILDQQNKNPSESGRSRWDGH